MHLLVLTQELHVAQLQEVQTLFECTKYIPDFFFLSYYLHGINQTACHKYVNESRGSVSSRAQRLQTIADGSRLTDGWLISRKLKSSVQNGIVGGLLGGAGRKKISLLHSLGHSRVEPPFRAALTQLFNPRLTVFFLLPPEVSADKGARGVENWNITLENGDSKGKCMSCFFTMNFSFSNQVKTFVSLVSQVVVCWHWLKAQTLIQFVVSWQ